MLQLGFQPEQAEISYGWYIHFICFDKFKKHAIIEDCKAFPKQISFAEGLWVCATIACLPIIRTLQLWKWYYIGGVSWILYSYLQMSRVVHFYEAVWQTRITEGEQYPVPLLVTKTVILWVVSPSSVLKCPAPPNQPLVFQLLRETEEDFCGQQGCSAEASCLLSEVSLQWPRNATEFHIVLFNTCD